MLKYIFRIMGIAVVLFLFTPTPIIAQKYNIAAGVRWGGEFGISIAERIDKRVTLEQNFNSENEKHSYSLFALARYHQPIITKRFNWFYGGGIGVVGVKKTDDYPRDNSISVMLQTGLEFTINRATFYIALEPFVYSANNEKHFLMHKVFSLKYVLVKRKSLWRKKILDKLKFKKRKKKNKKPWWKFWKKNS